MSGDWDDEPAAVWSETHVRARKAHRCSACSEEILAGHGYVRHVIINEVGDRPTVIKRCSRCEAIYRHLRSIESDYLDQPDPRLDCGHTYDEIHGKPPPDDVAALAFALPGETQIGGGR